MGTQTYCMVAKKYIENKPNFVRFVSKEGRKSTSIVEEFSEGVSYLYYDDREVNYTTLITEQECRELVIQDIQLLRESYQREEPYIFAIRMGGEQHDKVSRLMQGKNKCALVEKVLSNTLNLRDFEIRSGKFSTPTSNNYWRPFNDTTVKRKSEIKPIPFYIDIYTNNELIDDPEFPVKLSALIAMLREPRLIQGILDGSVVTPADIAKKLLEIAEDRQKKADESYICWKLSPYGTDDDIKRQLDSADNDDASDGYSIAVLALFTLAVYYNIGGVDFYDCSGPVDCIESCDSVYDIAEKTKELDIDISNIVGGTFETLNEYLIDNDEEFVEMW